MKNKIFLIIILVILIVGCIGVYYSNNEGMFVFNKDDNDKIIKIEKENKQLSLKELSNIVFTVEKSTKKSTDMSFVENVKESYNELVHKVSWPTRKELAQSSVIVLIASIILALIVFAMDQCFESLMTAVYDGVSKLF